MDRSPTSALRARFDRVGLALSGVCAAHCIATIALVSALGLGGELLLAPAIHRVGLAIALVVAAVAIGWGSLRHRSTAPFLVALAGLGFMAAALTVSHGPREAVLTIIGVALLSFGHLLNLRRAH